MLECPPVLDLLFSDRAWVLKLLATLLLFAALCRGHREAMARLRPSEEVIHHPAPHELGGTVRRWGLPVRAVDAAGFQVELRSGPVGVSTPDAPALRPGDRVAFSARLVGPRALAAEEVAVIHGLAWKRALNYLVSTAVVLFVLWRIRDRFRARPSDGLFRGRT